MSPIDGRDYINASDVLPSNHNDPDRASILPNGAKMSFIAAQGPTIETCPHFLQMIHEQKVDIVVVLTKVQESEGRNIDYAL